MAMEIEFEPMMDVWLRDTEGHRLVTARMTTFSGTYEPGGVILTPEMFGLSDIEFLYAQATIAVPDVEVGGSGDGWSMLFLSSLMKYNNDWRFILHWGPAILGMDDLSEVAEGTPIEMLPAYSPVALVVGS